MMYPKQTPEMFQEKKAQVTEEYKKYQENFKWNFKSTTQVFGDIEKFYITSGDMSCIITYDYTTKYMRVVNLIRADLKILNSLNEGLR